MWSNNTSISLFSSRKLRTMTSTNDRQTKKGKMFLHIAYLSLSSLSWMSWVMSLSGIKSLLFVLDSLNSFLVMVSIATHHSISCFESDWLLFSPPDSSGWWRWYSVVVSSYRYSSATSTTTTTTINKQFVRSSIAINSICILSKLRATSSGVCVIFEEFDMIDTCREWRREKQQKELSVHLLWAVQMDDEETSLLTGVQREEPWVSSLFDDDDPVEQIVVSSGAGSSCPRPDQSCARDDDDDAFLPPFSSLSLFVRSASPHQRHSSSSSSFLHFSSRCSSFFRLSTTRQGQPGSDLAILSSSRVIDQCRSFGLSVRSCSTGV